MSELDTNVLKNGQLAVATVAQSGEIISSGGELDATAVVQTDNGPQKCVKTFSVGGGGGGGGGETAWGDITGTLSNQTDLNTALNKKLENKATGTNAVTIIGSATSKSGAVNIGNTSSAGTAYNVAIGQNASASGNNVSASPAYGASTVAYGYYSSASAGTALGSMTTSTNGVAIGRGYSTAKKVIANSNGSIAIGFITAASDNCAATAAGAIQIGNGQNSTANTVQFNSYQVLDANGKIPADRITGVITLTTSSVQLAHDNIYNGAELASVTFTLPNTVPVNFIAQLNFTSGTTATVLNAPAGVYFDGDDCIGGVFTPAASKRYQVLITNDGVTTLGYVLSH